MEYQTADYTVWAGNLRPRTCLLVHWLNNLGAVEDPGDQVRENARRFADKRLLLGRLVDSRGGETSEKTNWLLDNNEFDIYVAWLMWLRVVEYVPQRFITEEGREKVLAWIRTQLRRPELNSEETLGELRWQVERLQKSWGRRTDEDLRRSLGF